MKREHYCQQDIIRALHTLGVRKGDVLFCHSNIGFLGVPKGCQNIDEIVSCLYEAFVKVIGPEGTLVLPTFTYSFPQGKIYDPEKTPSDCGIFSEKIRQFEESHRSFDPNISVVAIGKHAKALTEHAPEDSYGEEGFFARFYRANGKICNINFDAGSTFVHYVERQLSVPYRFTKTFSGTVLSRGQELARKSQLWVRRLHPATIAKFEPFHNLATERGKYVQTCVGRGSIGVISASDTFILIKQTFQHRPWFLTAAEAMQINLYDVLLDEKIYGA